MNQDPEKLHVIFFHANWCKPCQVIKPRFAATAEDFPDEMFAKVNIDVNKEVSKAAGIKSMPTF